MNFSLKTFLIVTAIIGLSLVSFRTGGSILWLTLFGFLSIYCAFIIQAFVSPATKRIFSIGFVIASTLYATSVYVAGTSELSSKTGHLPKSYYFLGQIFPLFRHDVWMDPANGECVPNYNPSNAGTQKFMVSISIPDERAFFIFGHVLLAAIFGILGGVYADYARRPINTGKHNEPSDAPKSPVSRKFES